jgi:iron complex outermembrane receptor protein
MINGLRINGDVNYNDSYYSKFNAPCYVGQSIAEGCSLTPVAGAFTQQDLSGREVTNAPKWVGSLGFSYSMPIAWGRLEFGADGVYKSVYNASSDLTPGALQNASTTLSAQVRLISADGHWEFGVYGKNLTNVYSALDSIPVPLTGNSANTGTVRGGIASRADLAGDTNPGRAVFLQLAYHLR